MASRKEEEKPCGRNRSIKLEEKKTIKEHVVIRISPSVNKELVSRRRKNEEHLLVVVKKGKRKEISGGNYKQNCLDWP